MSDTNQKSSFIIHEAFSPEVDFAIWLLELDGLQVSPFDQHTAGNCLLRNQGLTEESWMSWLTNWHGSSIIFGNQGFLS
jgi:hypothetical protein